MSESLFEQWKLNCKFLKKGYAQVETLVRPQMVRPKSGELKLSKSKPHRLMARFSNEEKEIVRQKAKAVSFTVNQYIRAVALGRDYKPKINPDLHRALLMLNRELTAQGRNLNQIAKHLNAGLTTPSQGAAMLESIRVPLIQALQAVKKALAHPAPQP